MLTRRKHRAQCGVRDAIVTTFAASSVVTMATPRLSSGSISASVAKP